MTIAGSRPGTTADDVAQPRLARDRLEAPAGHPRAQPHREPAQLRRAGGALAAAELELDQLPGLAPRRSAVGAGVRVAAAGAGADEEPQPGKLATSSAVVMASFRGAH